MDFPGGLQSGLLGPAFSRSALSGPVSGRSRKQLERPNDILLDNINLRVIMHYETNKIEFLVIILDLSLL